MTKRNVPTTFLFSFSNLKFLPSSIFYSPILFQGRASEYKSSSISITQHVPVLQLEKFQICRKGYLADLKTKYSLQNFPLKLHELITKLLIWGSQYPIICHVKINICRYQRENSIYEVSIIFVRTWRTKERSCFLVFNWKQDIRLLNICKLFYLQSLNF